MRPPKQDPGSHGAGTSVSERPYPPCWTSSGRWAPACLPAVSRYHSLSPSTLESLRLILSSPSSDTSEA
uniref:Uncharacterized protein n=1 Tax=Timema bartmani TaxID=61472 RepID=A0A7R9EPL8_9NEOP|nr:unnamed protein product [Timema bartmani]